MCIKQLVTEKSNFLGETNFFFHFGHDNTWTQIRIRSQIRIDLKCWIRIRINSVADPKLLISDPDPDPTFQSISDPDPDLTFR